METPKEILEMAKRCVGRSCLYDSLESVFRDALSLHYGPDVVVRVSIRKDCGVDRWKEWIPNLEALTTGVFTDSDGTFLKKTSVMRALNTNSTFINHLTRAGYLKSAKKIGKAVLFRQDDVLQLAALKDSFVRKYKNRYRGSYLLNELRRLKKENLLG